MVNRVWRHTNKLKYTIMEQILERSDDQNKKKPARTYAATIIMDFKNNFDLFSLSHSHDVVYVTFSTNQKCQFILQ